MRITLYWARRYIWGFHRAELFGVARELKLSADEAMQMFKRKAFNVIARNYDDHSENFGFMLDDQYR